jgi:signal transduction histidine kinase
MTIGADIKSPGTRRSTEQEGKRARRFILQSANRWLAVISPVGATVALTVIAIVLAESLHLIIEAIAYPAFDVATLVSAAVVTVLVAAPIIYYSQLLIRSVVSSRQALKQLTEKLALALDEAQKASDLKARFVANMSHELRTPLNAIIGYAELLSEQKLGPLGTPRYAEFARDIRQSGAHLLGIVNDMLDLAKIQSGAIATPENAECNLATCVDEALRMIRPSAEKQRVHLEVALPDRCIDLAVSDRMLRQILLNILSNAVKFTPGEGRVSLTAGVAASGDLLITIADSGLGMTSGDIAIALTPFGQVDNAFNRKVAGTGLGLPLAKAMMELHDGRLSIRSVPRLGTTITLSFPPSRIVAPAAARLAS